MYKQLYLLCECVCVHLTSSQLSQPVSIYHSGLIQSGPVSQSELGWLPLPASHHATGGGPATPTKTSDRKKGKERKTEKGERGGATRKKEHRVNKVSMKKETKWD